LQDNIVINAQGNPLLTDFGLSSIAEDLYSVTGSITPGGGTLRWSAPELLGSFTAQGGEWVNPTTQSDVYSLAMVIIEVTHQFCTPSVQALMRLTYCSKVFTGKVPFPNFNDVRVVIAISRGERPPKPPGGEGIGLRPTVWKLTEECWDQSPGKRPDVTSVLRRLQAVIDTGL